MARVSAALRAWNHGATVFLVAVVFLGTLKGELGTIWGLLGALLFGIALTIAVRMYRSKPTAGGDVPGS